MAAVVSACAPVSTSRRIVESPQVGAVQRDAAAQRAPELTMVVAASGDGVEISSVDRLTCLEHDVTIVHRKEIRHRHVNTPVTVMEYVLGIGLGGLGGYAIAAPEDAASHSGSAELQPTDVRKVGIGVASVGGLFLLSGIINSVRGGTSEHALGDDRRIAAAGKPVDCGSSPRAGDALAIAAGGKSWPIGTTDHDGHLRLAWTAVPAEIFATDEWHSAQVIPSAGSTAKPVAIALEPARDVASTRAWEALAAAPSLEGVHAYLARFGGTRDAEAKQLLVTLADKTYGPPTDEAIARADVEAARTSLTAWSAEAPESAQRTAAAATFAQLEQAGPATYLYARFEASLADPTKLADAERTLASFATVAPADPRLAPARALLAQRRAAGDQARIKGLQAHVGQARHFARHAELDRAATELAAAKKLATPADDKLIAATAAYVEQYRLADEKRQALIAAQAQAAADAKSRREQAAADAKAKREEALAAEKARREEAAAAEKAKRDELAAQTAEERAKIAERAAAEKLVRDQAAADAKAKRDELAAAEKAKREQAAIDAKARRDEAAATQLAAAAAEKTKREEAAAEAKAKREEARLAAITDKAKREEARLAAAQLAAADKARREEGARGRTSAVTPLPRTGMAGMWAAPIAGSIWLLDLGADGNGRTALWQAGRLVALRPVSWRVDADALVLQVGSSTVRARAERTGDALTWSGLAWRRQ